MASIGLKEYQDVTAALNYIHHRDEIKNANIGFAGFCMGANSTIIAMSNDPEVFTDVKMPFPGSADFYGSIFKNLPGHVYYAGWGQVIHANGKKSSS